jgi:hypothetical protein
LFKPRSAFCLSLTRNCQSYWSFRYRRLRAPPLLWSFRFWNLYNSQLGRRLSETRVSVSAVGFVTRQSDDRESPPPLVPLIVRGEPLDDPPGTPSRRNSVRSGSRSRGTGVARRLRTAAALTDQKPVRWADEPAQPPNVRCGWVPVRRRSSRHHYKKRFQAGPASSHKSCNLMIGRAGPRSEGPTC